MNKKNKLYFTIGAVSLVSTSLVTTSTIIIKNLYSNTNERINQASTINDLKERSEKLAAVSNDLKAKMNDLTSSSVALVDANTESIGKLKESLLTVLKTKSYLGEAIGKGAMILVADETNNNAVFKIETSKNISTQASVDALVASFEKFYEGKSSLKQQSEALKFCFDKIAEIFKTKLNNSVEELLTVNNDWTNALETSFTKSLEGFNAAGKQVFNDKWTEVKNTQNDIINSANSSFEDKSIAQTAKRTKLNELIIEVIAAKQTLQDEIDVNLNKALYNTYIAVLSSMYSKIKLQIALGDSAVQEDTASWKSYSEFLKAKLEEDKEAPEEKQKDPSNWETSNIPTFTKWKEEEKAKEEKAKEKAKNTPPSDSKPKNTF